MLHMTFRREVLAAKRQKGIALMGICNVTPDSFSDGGLAWGLDAARRQVDALILAGADVVDIGAESTRPGAPRVSAAEQLDRLGELVRYASARVLTSIDTTRACVAEEGVRQGAHLVNDVSMGLDDSDAMASLVARTGVAWCLSHARGAQETMKGFGDVSEGAYAADVTAVVVAELRAAMNEARARAAVDPAAMLADPGLGFDKSSKHSMQLLADAERLVGAFDGWLLVGASRKSFLTLALQPAPAAEQRLGASLAAALWAQRAGVALVRVHDVAQTRQALQLETTLSRRSFSQSSAERSLHA